MFFKNSPTLQDIPVPENKFWEQRSIAYFCKSMVDITADLI